MLIINQNSGHIKQINPKEYKTKYDLIISHSDFNKPFELFIPFIFTLLKKSQIMNILNMTSLIKITQFLSEDEMVRLELEKSIAVYEILFYSETFSIEKWIN